MNYLKYTFEIGKNTGDVLVAYLSEFSFESFLEDKDFVEAFIPENESLDEKHLVEVLKEAGFLDGFRKELIEDQNWNEKWESDYPIVTVGDELIVRAPFHRNIEQKYGIDIQIQPKMSFGTGHHETTFLMLQFLLDAEIKGKDVLDMGSGTGVLAIAADKMKAHSVLAVDIEDWAFENTCENVDLNSAQVDVDKGNVSALTGRSFDIILANINKNVLLSDMKAYAESLNYEGELYLSGFFGTDVDDIHQKAREVGLELFKVRENKNWAAMHLKKQAR